jgi:hypothetical protein
MAWSDFYMQTTGSDLNAGSTNADAAVYTSTAGNWDGTSVFTPTDNSIPANSVNVGDWCSIYPTGNTATPYVAQVTAVGAGSNGTITLSTTLKFGSAPTNNSGSRNAKTGGAWASLAMLASGNALNTGTVTQSTRINVKAGTYANTTTARTFGMAGAATTPLLYRGYKTSIGDQVSSVSGVAGTDIPTFTSTTGQFTSSGGNAWFQNIDVNGAVTGSGGLWSNTGSNNSFHHCRFTNTASNANSSAFQCTSTGNAVFLLQCYFSATTTATRSVYFNASVYNVLAGCYTKGGAEAIESSSLPTILYKCILDSPGTDGFKPASSFFMFECTIYAGSATGNGVNQTTVGGNGDVMVNCYVEGFSAASKAGYNNTSGTNTSTVRLAGNAWFNNTSNTSGIQETFTWTDNGTLSASGLASPSTDFTPKNALWDIGTPGGFETFTVFTSQTDVGAVDHLSTGGPTGQIMRVTGQHYQAN